MSWTYFLEVLKYWQSNNKHQSYLVGGFNPIWKILVKLDHFPTYGVKITNHLSCHHPAIHLTQTRCTSTIMTFLSSQEMPRLSLIPGIDLHRHHRPAHTEKLQSCFFESSNFRHWIHLHPHNLNTRFKILRVGSHIYTFDWFEHIMSHK